jgi:predicted nucleic acid-binding protein
MPGSFFDTNILIYIASADRAKADKAEALLIEGGVISVQVLNEIANVARRKMGLSWVETSQFLEAMQAFLHVEPLTVEVHEAGLDLAQRHGLSLYDAMIVASALRAECETLWSEDMQHGRTLDGRLRIVNPFR